MFRNTSPRDNSSSFHQYTVGSGNPANSESQKMTEKRVLMLSEKIGNLKLGQKAESDKKHQLIEKACEDIQSEIETIRANFENSCVDIKHIIGNIEKELNHDYAGTDQIVKDEIRRTEDRFIQITENHMSERKKSDARLSKFADEKCAVLRDLIEREAKQRNSAGQQIEQSLTNDILEIKSRLDDEKHSASNNLEQIHTQFLQEYEQMRKQFDEICQKSSVSEGQFYKMLRDILKKVKDELAQDKTKRQEMEETILALIEKICDKAMQEGRE